MYQLNLNNRVALVTGANRGIGRQIAIDYARAGAKVALGFGSDENAAATVAEEIKALGAEVLLCQADVTSAESCQGMIDQVESGWGQLDILVNNAGTTRDNLFAMLEDEDWERVLQVNLMGAVHCSKAAVRGMMMRRYGRIINISSVAGAKGGRGQANYAASKAALEATTRSLAVELGSRNITVNAICPGVIETAMSAEVRKLGAAEIKDRQVIKRFGKPEDVSPWAVMLAAEQSSFVTGQCFYIDGGFKLP